MNQGDKKSIGRIALQQRARPTAEAEPVVKGPLATKPAEVRADPVSELKLLSEKFGVPAIDLTQVCVRLSDLELIPLEIARRHVILPVLVREDRPFVALANPHDQKVIDELEFVTDKKVYPYVALPDLLTTTIGEAYGMRARDEQFFIGSDCPPEVVKRAQASEEPRTIERGAPEQKPAVPRGPVEQAGVVVDDAIGRVQRASEVPDEDFGDLSKELSVVTDIPDTEMPTAVPGSKTVLVVDDEPDIRLMLERL